MEIHEDKSDLFSICFNMMKIKYKDYDDSLTSKNMFNKYDKVNVFINLESVFKYISNIQDLEKLILLHRDFDVLMISNILNLVAHYKRFFVSNGFDTKIFIYNTDFNSEEFPQFKYNEDYRSYYLIKFNTNPKYTLFTDHLKDEILPDLKTYCDFIPNVYYINCKNIEGSLVPYIIANSDTSRKNVIVGSEFYDTLYSGISNFVNYYIHKSFNINSISSDIKGYIKDITRKSEDIDDLISTFQNYSLYCSLMSVIGDKNRSIDGVTGCGIKTLQKKIKDGILKGEIKQETTSPELIQNIFTDPDERQLFYNNYYCSSIIHMYNELTEAQKTSILNQLIDRIDLNSIRSLNQTKFYNHMILLDALL